MTSTPVQTAAQTPSQRWEQTLGEASDRARAATIDQVKAAVLLLATGARECWPPATRLTLSPSDQGNWLWLDTFDGLQIAYAGSSESESTSLAHDAAIADFSDRFDYAASYLDQDNLDASSDLETDDEGLTYFIDIAKTLDR